MTYATTSTNTISMYDGAITFNFDGNYPVGTYWNGDPFIVTPGTIGITSISPASTNVGGDGRWRNGAQTAWMVGAECAGGSSPGPGVGSVFSQGMDAKADINFTYDANKNMDPGRTGQPWSITGEETVFKCVSRASPGTAPRPVNDWMGYLTVVNTTPTQDSWRPAPFTASKSTQKAATYTFADIDWTRLPNLAPTANTPTDYDAIISKIRYCHFMSHLNYDHARHFMSSNQMNNYGANNARDIATAALWACTTQGTTEQRQNVIKYLIQIGFDVYERCKNGGVWYGNGGLYHGYKLPLVLAATFLQDQDMIDLCDGTTLNNGTFRNFGEDQQTFIIQPSDVSRDLAFLNIEYLAGDVGMPEWGEQHQSSPGRDGRQWFSPSRSAGEQGAGYRQISLRYQVGAAMATNIITGARAVWNWPAFHWYTDRLCNGTFYFDGGSDPYGNPPNGDNPVSAYATGNSGNEFSTFAVEMFNAYRATYGGELWTWANKTPSPGPPAPPASVGLLKSRLFGTVNIAT
jgi:hypothetical protein